MRDSIDDDDIDRAYRMALETTTDVAVVRRRRGAVLEAIERLDAVHATRGDRQRAAPGDRTDANAAHRHPSAMWWRGVAAACVIGTSTLVVVHMQQAPEATVKTRLRSDADRIVARAGESTATEVAEVATRQSGLATAREPAPAIVTGATRRAPIGSATPAAGVPSITASDHAAKAARTALPGDDIETTVSTGSVGRSGASAGATDAATRELAVAALTSTPTRTPVPTERQEGSSLRTEQSSAKSRQALGAVAVLPPSHAAVEAGNAAVRAPSKGLLDAVNKGDIEVARTLLQTTDPDAERDADGRTALAIAVLRADLPLVKLLLASGADRRAVDRFGHTPLSYASASTDATMLQALGRP
jgi:Ankyrin repeats (3 copies)